MDDASPPPSPARLKAVPAHSGGPGMGGLAYVATSLSAGEEAPPTRAQQLLTCGPDGTLSLRSPSDPASTLASDPAAADGAPLTCLAVSPDGKRAVTGDGRNWVRVS